MNQPKQSCSLHAIVSRLAIVGMVLGSATCALATQIQEPARQSKVLQAGVVMAVFALAALVQNRWRGRPVDHARAVVDILNRTDRRLVPLAFACGALVLGMAGAMTWWFIDAKRAWLLLHPAWVAGIISALVEWDRRQRRRRAYVLFALYSAGQCDEPTRHAIDAARVGDPDFEAAVREHLDVLARCKEGLV